MFKHVLDTELLIAVVKSSPELWDRKHELYKCASSTTNAWRSVCKMLDRNFDSLKKHEQNNLIQIVMKRWKNIRDAYAKAQKRIAQDNTLTGKFPKKYIFHEQLEFLNKAQNKTNDCESPAENDTESESENEQDSNDFTAVEAAEDIDIKPNVASSPCSSMANNFYAPSVDTTDRPKRKRKLDHNETIDKTERADNRHMLFFRSLIPSLTQLKEEQVLEFQVGVLKILQTVRKTVPDSSPECHQGWTIEDSP